MTKAKVSQGIAVVELIASILRADSVGVVACFPTKVMDPCLMLNNVDMEAIAIGLGGFCKADGHGIRHSGEGSDENNATEGRHDVKLCTRLHRASNEGTKVSPALPFLSTAGWSNRRCVPRLPGGTDKDENVCGGASRCGKRCEQLLPTLLSPQQP